MRKCLVRDAATAATAARIFEILRGCENILGEHRSRAEQGLYGEGLLATALRHDLWAAQQRIDMVRLLITGDPENSSAQ